MPPPKRFNPSAIKNKMKREDVSRSLKKAKRQDKLKRRLALAEAERNDPEARKVRDCQEFRIIYEIMSQTKCLSLQERQAKNIPKTLDNMREFDPAMLTANPADPVPGPSNAAGDESDMNQVDEVSYDIANDPFASYFHPAGDADPSNPPKLLITTSMKATRTTYDFCEELVGVFPDAEFIRRKKGKGFEMGRIAGWAAGRGYAALIVVNEDRKTPSTRSPSPSPMSPALMRKCVDAITLVHLPNGPTAYFKLTSIQLTKQIFVRLPFSLCSV
jgi:ribosome production factor 1